MTGRRYGSSRSWIACAAFVVCANALAVDREALLSTFEIHPAFQIELVAAEPQIYDPVDLAFDERGRAFVMEMPGYPFPEEAGRVILLEDTDGDGYWDSRKVFADDLAVADSLLPYAGGFLVASPPDLLFLRDTDGDDIADVREVLLTGFATGNPQHNFNGLNHGLDNWIYGSNGGNSGTLRSPKDPDLRLPLRGHDFRFNPRTGEVERFGRSTGGFEATFDDFGNYFGTHNLMHVRQMAIPGRYLDGLPVAPRAGLINISDHEEKGLSRIFPIGTQDTRVNHPEQSGYFSGACGITFYGGGAFPEGFNGNLFVMDVVLNLVHRDVLSQDGPILKASRARQRKEFLASTDRGFRPVNMTTGPDGALYLLDMHRMVIEHPEWIPDELEREMDLDEGKQEGRIYRITPKGGLPKSLPRFERNSIETVVAALEYPNKWWRETAQRLLVEWEAEEAVDGLLNLLQNSESPQARIHALWTLEGLGELLDDDLAAAMRDPHPAVRRQALLAVEPIVLSAFFLRNAVLGAIGDPEPSVRMQALLSAHDVVGSRPANANVALLEAVERDAADPLMRLAILSSVREQPLRFLNLLLSRSEGLDAPGVDLLSADLARAGATSASGAAVADLLGKLPRTGESSTIVARILGGLADGLERNEREFSDRETAQVAALLDPAFDDIKLARPAWQLLQELSAPLTTKQRVLLASAMARASDDSLSTAERLDNLNLVRFADFDSRKDVLFELLNPLGPQELQLAAIQQLRQARAPEIGVRLVTMWPELGPGARSEAADILLYLRANHETLLTAIEEGIIAVGQLNLDLERRRVLLHSMDSDIVRRAQAIFTDAGVVTRAEALERMRPALALSGDLERGSTLYLDLCSKCHRLGDVGTDLGPNLTDIFRKSPETLLHDILDPNAAVDAQFIAYDAETADGELLSGIVSRETDEEITLRQAQDIEVTLRKSELERFTSSGLSLMPEELEVDLELQEMADLIAFLLEPR